MAMVYPSGQRRPMARSGTSDPAFRGARFLLIPVARPFRPRPVHVPSNGRGKFMAVTRPRRYAFVPRLLVRTAVASVVPACALAATDGCGGSTATLSKDGGPYGVAAVAYPAYEAGRDAPFGVAAVAYPAYEAGGPETGGHDSGATDSSSKDALPDVFGVAAVAYPAYEGGGG
jgi:hypothetical protein